jgi:hypothetical protein
MEGKREESRLGEEKAEIHGRDPLFELVDALIMRRRPSTYCGRAMQMRAGCVAGGEMGGFASLCLLSPGGLCCPSFVVIDSNR